MNDVKTYYFGTELLPHYADTTEPNLYPNKFTALVHKDKFVASEEENLKLKALVRFLYLTLGFYATKYNYEQKIGLPDGSWKTGIEQDEGHDANYAINIANRLCGYSGDEIQSWGSVFKSLEESQEFSKANWNEPTDRTKEIEAKQVRP